MSNDFSPVRRTPERPVRLQETEFVALEVALGRTLTPDQREGLQASMQAFMNAVCDKPRIPTERRYLAQLLERLDEVKRTSSLLTMLTSFRPASVHEEVWSLKDVKDYFGGMEPVKAAISAGRTTRTDAPSYAPEDCVRLCVTRELPSLDGHLGSLRAVIENLRRQVQERKDQLPEAGDDAHYELHLLYRQLVTVAAAAGDALEITSHKGREEESNEKITRLVSFVSSALGIIRDSYPKMVAESDLPPPAKDQALKVFAEYVNKKDMNLLEPLEAARRWLLDQ